MTEATTAPNSTIPELTPELLQLLAGDPDDLIAVCLAHQPADVAVALRELPGSTAAAIIASLPFEYAVEVLDKPELEHHRYEVIRGLDLARAAPLIEAHVLGPAGGALPRAARRADRERFLAALLARHPRQPPAPAALPARLGRRDHDDRARPA